jgi:hypothetical protein
MNMLTRLKRGQGPIWNPVERAARAVLSWHLPVNRLTRPVWHGLYATHVALREAWIWTRRFCWNEPLLRSQCEWVGEGLWMEELPYLQGTGRIVIGRDVRLSGKPHIAFNNHYVDRPKLSIGDGTFIGHLCNLRIARSVTIGRHCLIAGGVMIADYDGDPLDAVVTRDVPADCVVAGNPARVVRDLRPLAGEASRTAAAGAADFHAIIE